MGIINYHQKRFHEKDFSKECYRNEERKVDMITLIHLHVGFYFLVLGYTLAFIRLVVEIISEKLSRLKKLEQISVDSKSIQVNLLRKQETEREKKLK